ncbi:hypothetical protein GUITHDRAFT_132357 [Guillardia theta CCMP2712]|uniref:CBM20 domain-containing protein n=1 Tax=Guillardia theta (strain CCMP2712) TaxID=905079 RepID=L1K0E1_GUITC|nr:hypothetical protein GUITHDRAFT_132357 [Guillardia theta CCMP2712]EKX53915.1 hypothetical protein GUITHDRAFT_132357 [Guillardia theta CCMP2712]|eukprot:XP_005840895.1 hypothetical protein GUITHDRAFT_132357 [Guillardia theta CCMP2712]
MRGSRAPLPVASALLVLSSSSFCSHGIPSTPSSLLTHHARAWRAVWLHCMAIQILRGGGKIDLSSDLSDYLEYFPDTPEDSKERWELRRKQFKEYYQKMEENQKSEQAEQFQVADKLRVEFQECSIVLLKVSAPHVLDGIRGGQKLVLSGNLETTGLWHADKLDYKYAVLFQTGESSAVQWEVKCETKVRRITLVNNTVIKDHFVEDRWKLSRIVQTPYTMSAEEWKTWFLYHIAH